MCEPLASPLNEAGQRPLIIGDVITGFDLCAAAGFVRRVMGNDTNPHQYAFFWPISPNWVANRLLILDDAEVLPHSNRAISQSFKRPHAGSSAFFSLIIKY